MILVINIKIFIYFLPVHFVSYKSLSQREREGGEERKKEKKNNNKKKKDKKNKETKKWLEAWNNRRLQT